MNDIDDDVPPLCIPVYVTDATQVLNKLSDDIFHLLPAGNSKLGRKRSEIITLINSLRHEIAALNRLGQE